MVHGIRSPALLLPRDKLFIIDDFDISPSKQIYKTQQDDRVPACHLITITCIIIALISI